MLSKPQVPGASTTSELLKHQAESLRACASVSHVPLAYAVPSGISLYTSML